MLLRGKDASIWPLVKINMFSNIFSLEGAGRREWFKQKICLFSSEGGVKIGGQSMMFLPPCRVGI